MAAAFAVLAAGAFGCRQDMHDQPRYEPLEASKFFADGMASRQLPEGTVARGHLGEDVAFTTGKDAAGNVVAELPVPATKQLLERGHQCFDIYCSACHGRLGDGHGMAVRRGFKQPPSFHIDRLRDSPPGYFFDVMTNGFSTMSSYASQVPPEDRWAIAAYIRALQLSQQVKLRDLPAEERQRAEEALRQAAAAPAPGEGDEHSGHESGGH